MSSEDALALASYISASGATPSSCAIRLLTLACSTEASGGGLGSSHGESSERLMGHQCTNSAIKMMMGIGIPRKNKSIERMDASKLALR